ncbi:DUF421 domain-containing protein [Olivibacter jilunii]|uniref:DUF421 domain-containing protein n=1 Tax=Olivibacter jilunii TaxID=985016 RepID=UPI003F143F04
MEKTFFNNWESLGRTLIIGILAYVLLIAMLRLSGKRTLSELKEFDFIVSVALGSTVSTVILDKNISLSDGVLALGLLILLQFVVAKWSHRSKKFQQVASSSPSLIFYKGQFLRESMRKERIMEHEVRSVIRSQGLDDIRQVAAVVLEPNGQFSVVKSGNNQDEQSSIYKVKSTKNDNF